MENKDKFIKKYAEYIYKKYYFSRFIEEEYIHKFADIEIENMENIYEYLIYDQKIENRFYPNQFLTADFNQNLNFDDEYKDLESQISRLKYRKKNNIENLNKFKKYINNQTIEFIEFVVSKINPEVNSTKKARKLWDEYIDSIKKGNLDLSLELLENINKTKVNKMDNDFEDLVVEVELMLENLENSYPLNLSKILKSKKKIEAKFSELRKDVTKSKEALNKITAIYLQVSESKGLES